MLDETIITETPPLYRCYGRIGEQVGVPITGNRAKRILHGTINLGSGDTLLLITHEWVQETHQVFLRMIRSHWRGWNLVLFEDRGSPHTAAESQALAADLGIELRWLPRACPALNAMDQLWRHTKGYSVASRATESIDVSTNGACVYIYNLSPEERLKQAGVLSGDFWLADCLHCQRTF
jgi:transposase